MEDLPLLVMCLLLADVVMHVGKLLWLILRYMLMDDSE